MSEKLEKLWDQYVERSVKCITVKLLCRILTDLLQSSKCTLLKKENDWLGHFTNKSYKVTETALSRRGICGEFKQAKSLSHRQNQKSSPKRKSCHFFFRWNPREKCQPKFFPKWRPLQLSLCATGPETNSNSKNFSQKEDHSIKCNWTRETNSTVLGQLLPSLCIFP